MNFRVPHPLRRLQRVRVLTLPLGPDGDFVALLSYLPLKSWAWAALQGRSNHSRTMGKKIDGAARLAGHTRHWQNEDAD